MDKLPETGTVIPLEGADTIPTHNSEDVYGVEDFSKVVSLGDERAAKLNEWKPREVVISSLAILDREFKERKVTSMVVAFTYINEEGVLCSRWHACSENRLELAGLATEIAAFYVK